MSVAIIVLAAGHGTRMKSDLPKVLHKIGGAPMLAHAIRATDVMTPERRIVIAGYRSDLVSAAAQDIEPTTEIAIQAEQNGTADAVRAAEGTLDGFDGDAIVLLGDTPFVASSTFEAIMDARRSGADLVVLGFRTDTPGGYGRLVTNGDRLLRIVEAKDASPEERAIDLCNSGILAANAQSLFRLIAEVQPNNAQGEYYLTDTIEIAVKNGLTTKVVTCDENETLGVNSRADLARAEAIFQSRARAEALSGGVTLTAPETVYFSLDTVIGQDVEIGPNVIFGPGVTIESGARIVGFCHLEGCHVGAGATIGPFARLRPGAEIGGDARIGNFVEVKEAEIGPGAKVNHLTYIGDATIGRGANVGAGTITCNYDGVFKHRTEIGENAFVGSNSALVAPVRIGNDAVVGSGAVVTKDVEDGALALARGEQTNKIGMGRRFMDRLRAKKAAGKRP